MSDGSMERSLKSSHLAGGNLDYLDELYEHYLADSNSVPNEWRQYFDSLPRVEGVIAGDVPHSTIQEQFLLLGKDRSRAVSAGSSSVSSDFDRKQVQVQRLITAYRIRGHQRAALDPLGLMQRQRVPDLELGFHDLSAADFDTVFQMGIQNLGMPEGKLKDIIAALDKTYCGSIGAEYMHIVDTEERLWLQNRLEGVMGKPDYPDDVKIHLLERLTAAEGLERYLQSRYPRNEAFWTGGW